MRKKRRDLTYLRLVVVIGLLLSSIGGSVSAPLFAQEGETPTSSEEAPTGTTTVYLPVIANNSDVVSEVDEADVGNSAPDALMPLPPESYDSDGENAPAADLDQVAGVENCASYVQFSNQSDSMIQVYWVDASGQELLYNTLDPGVAYWQHTYPGHVWKVRDLAGTLLNPLAIEDCHSFIITLTNFSFPQVASPAAAQASAIDASATFPLLAQFSGAVDTLAIGASESQDERYNNCIDIGDQTRTLNLPAGAAVRGAYLYWSGSGSLDSGVYLNGQFVSAQRTYNTSVYNGSTQLIFYGAVANVTSQVQSAGNFTVSSLAWSKLSKYCNFASAYGGWSLVVVYQKSGLPNSNIHLYEGFANTSFPTTSTLTVNMNGLADAACPRTAQLTHVSWEGDAYKGEYLSINGDYKGDNTYNGSTAPNLDIDSYSVALSAGQSSISMATQNYWVGSSLEFLINNAIVIKTNACAVPPTPTNTPAPPTPTPTFTPVPQLASLGDRFWKDTNSNGIQDAGEPAVADETVRLLDGNGNLLSQMQTNGLGNYRFTGLPAGDYIVEFIAPLGHTFTAQNAGGDDNVDSDANQTNGRTAVITLSPGENDDSVDAGLVAIQPTPTHTPAPTLGSIGNRVWKDLNGDGIQDVGETNVANVTVRLLNDSGGFITQLQTNTSGNYQFTNLAAGSYLVEFIAPAGHTFTLPNVGTNDAADSDANPSNGRTGAINLGAGQNIFHVDAGVVAVAPTPTNTTVPPTPTATPTQPATPTATPPPTLGSIGNRVWKDTNDNGLQDQGELGVPNITVRLLNTAGTVLANTATNSSGNYQFTNLAAGAYIVEFISPSDFAFTLANVGSNDATDSDADPVTGRTTVNLGAGQNLFNVDAGLITGTGPTPTPTVGPTPTNTPPPSGNATLGDKVFEDPNLNGIQDAGEPGVDGVAVKLFDCTTNAQVGSTTTANGGAYLFSGLNAGCYYIKVTAPTGFVFTKRDEGTDDGKDSDVARATGQSGNITLAEGETNLTVDAGLTRSTQLGTIGDLVWEDDLFNPDGIRNGPEGGLAGIRVDLMTCSGTFLASTTSAADGAYSFKNLFPGSYKIVGFRIPRYVFTLQDMGTDENLDSDVDRATGASACVTIGAGQTISTLDVGLFDP